MWKPPESDWKLCGSNGESTTTAWSMSVVPWWRHQMETFSTSLAICAVTGEFSAQRPVTLSFDAFFDPRLNKRLSIQSWNWWFDLVIRHISFVYYSCSLSNWNKLFQNDINTKRWCGHAGMLDDVILLFFPSYVSNVYFNCIVQYSLYHNSDIDTMSRWHCALVSCAPSQSIGLFFGVCTVLGWGLLKLVR